MFMLRQSGYSVTATMVKVLDCSRGKHSVVPYSTTWRSLYNTEKLTKCNQIIHVLRLVKSELRYKT